MKNLQKTALVSVEPDSKVRLKDVDPGATGGYRSKDETLERLGELRERIGGYQERLYAEGQRSLLIVFQALDTGGKDGAVRNLLTGINPAGIMVSSFKVPSATDLSHDFLWRIHQETPQRGRIGVWNRSHYEDVLVTRVHGLVSPKVCKERYRAINDFEHLLVANGTTICKFYLHISRDEQKRRLQARLDDPAKHWKFSEGDLKERAHWDAYQEAYEAALSHTSTPWAPWNIVPANHKWARDIAISECVAAALKKMNPQFPRVKFDPSKITLE